MNGAGSSEYGFGLCVAVGLPDFFNVKNCQHYAFGIAQRDLASRLQRLGEIFCNVQSDGHRPENATAEPHVVTNAFVIGLSHEPLQRRESSAHQQFQIADLAWREIPGWPFPGMSLKFCDSFRRGNQVGNFSTVWRN